MVPEVGVEPTRALSPPDFESGASASFTTPAAGPGRARTAGCERSVYRSGINLLCCRSRIQRTGLTIHRIARDRRTLWRKMRLAGAERAGSAGAGGLVTC